MDITPLASAPPDAVETLLDRAFGLNRRQRTAYRLREGVQWLPALSCAAWDGNGMLAGVLQAWPVELAHAAGFAPLVLIGPVAVDPPRQRSGIGRIMTDASLSAADGQGWPPQVLIGDPEYYGRFFGFEARHTAGWDVPGPVERHRLLAHVPSGLPLPQAGSLRPARDGVRTARMSGTTLAG